MKSAGTVMVGSEKYFLFLDDTKGKETYILFSPYHKDYIFYNDTSKRVLRNVAEVKEYYDDGYLVECVSHLKVSNTIKYYKDYHVIESILNACSFARNYTFNKEFIILNNTSVVMGEILAEFEGHDDNLHYKYTMQNGLISQLLIKYGAITLELNPVPFSIRYKDFEFLELNRIEKKHLLVASLKNITLPLLEEVLDMSWYVKDGVKQKNYSSVTTIAEFEEMVMTPMLMEIRKCAEANTKFYVSLDTETTGFGIYNLKKDNEELDHCVAVIVSWQEDQGVVIFTDMEHFNSVPNDYVWSRLAELFERFDGERTVAVKGFGKPTKSKVSSLDAMNFFDDFDDVELDGVAEVGEPNKELNVIDHVTFSRDTVDLIGHNVMFDKRVGIGEGYSIWFDDDTLQMSFDLNPLTVRGFNKLKGLTRRIFHHETPELSDILGKGNEDKYRYLVDREVAEIYGCADGDYTRKVFKYLKGIMSPLMYAHYKKQDIPMLNILPRSEYYGLRTIEKDVAALADESFNNLEILKQFIYGYVGSYVDYYQQRFRIETRNKAGYYASPLEYQNAISEIQYHEGKYYEFEFKPAEIRKVLFSIMKYPIVAYTDKHLPKIDKYALKKLKSRKRDPNDHYKKMNKDLLVYGANEREYELLRSSSSAKDQKAADKMVLISAKEFNSYKYPLAYVLSEYATLNKEYTSYFKPIREQNLEGKIFKSYNLARIETRRISNPAQTMKGNLKALIRSYSDDYYLLDFDMSQVEYRIMLSLSKHMLMVDRMKDPERDYHTETASLINRIPAHKVSKKLRKAAKSVSFGVPYGLGEMTLCGNLFGEVNSDTLLQTRMILAKWEENNAPIVTFLNKNRDNALLAWNMSEELRDFMGAWEKDKDGEFVLDTSGNKKPIPTGRVTNALGFYRTFNLSNIDFSDDAVNRRKSGRFVKEEAAIRRPAGNYPIQAFASELFRCILIRFYMRCEEEGINDLLIWHMLIHDELLCSVHKSLHPYYIYKLVKESCMVTMKGHTKYFVGINIGNTWAETKDDAREAPVYFVERMVQKWDAGEFGSGPFWFNDPWEELIKNDRKKYVEERIGEVVREMQPDVDTAPLNIPVILDTFSNYTVRAYVNDYPMNSVIDKSLFDKDDPGEMDEYQDRVWVSRFESWIIAYFGEGKDIINYDGVPCKVYTGKGANEKDVSITESPDYAELFNDDVYQEEASYWTFDEQEVSDIYEYEIGTAFEDDDDGDVTDGMDLSNKEAKNVAQLFRRELEYKHLKVLNEQVVVKVSSPSSMRKVKEWLTSKVTRIGNSVLFQTPVGIERWMKIKVNTDLHELDTFIDSIEKPAVTSEKLSAVSLLGKCVIVPCANSIEEKHLKSVLKPFVQDTGDYRVAFRNVFNQLDQWLFVTADKLELLDEEVNKVRR